MYKKIILLLLITLVFSCKKSEEIGTNDNEKDKIKTARLMLGNWENKSEDGTLSESWKKVNDSTYTGTSYFLKGKDTIHNETIELTQLGENLSYNATVMGQNDDKAVAFPLTKTTNKSLIFENPTHNYPKKITYTLVSKDSLVTEISGTQQGKPSSEKFILIRTK